MFLSQNINVPYICYAKKTLVNPTDSTYSKFAPVKVSGYYTPLHKKAGKTTKKTIDRSSSYWHYQKYLKEFFLSKCQVS